MSESEQTKPRRSPFYWIFLILVVIALGMSILLNIGLGAALMVSAPGMPHLDGEETAVDQFPEFDEEWSYGDGEAKVVRMLLSGLITRDGEAGLLHAGRDMIEDLTLAIRAATADGDVRAIILEVDSPGGAITPSDELYNELMRFKQSAEGRKVVIFMRDLAASGGYYVALAGDRLIAQPTTVVGSIGVIMQSLNWKTLSDKIGVTDTTIKSGDNKDLLNPFQPTNAQQIALLQDMIDAMHARFRGLVGMHRGIDDENLKTLADGRVFTATQALEHNLIDEIGYWDDAVASTAELLGVDAVKVVRYYRPYEFWDYLMAIRNPIDLIRSGLIEPPSRPQYLWRP